MQENNIEITIRTLLNLGQTSALLALRDSLKRDYELVEDALKQLSNDEEINQVVTSEQNPPITKKNDSKYDASWGFSDKFLYILKRERRFLKFRDAAKIIIEIEGFGDENKLTSSLTSSTRSIKEDGTIVKIKPGTSAVNTYWGSPKWLDDKGNIKPAYMYNESSIRKGIKKAGLFDL